MVERSRLQEIVAELELSQSKLVDPTTAVKMGKLANATHVVIGSFVLAGATLRLDTQLANVETTVVEVGKQIVGPKDEFFDLEKKVVNQLIAEIGAKPLRRRAAQGQHGSELRFPELLAVFQGHRPV